MLIGRWVMTKTNDVPTPDYGYIIGYPKGMSNCVVVASDDAIGCPINVCWVTPMGDFDVETAMELRERYETKFPGYLTPAEPEKA